MKKIYFPLILVALLMGSIACQPKQNSSDDTAKNDSLKAIPVKVLTLAEVEESNELSYATSISANETVYLAPASPGRVDKIHVEIGDRVSKGQLIAEMDKTQLRQAEIQLKQLEVDFNRMKTLSETNTISKQQYDQVKVQYDVALSNVNFLKENTNLLAPFSGIITEKYFEDGELYSGAPNTQAGKAAIVIIQQINPVKAIINISEKHFTNVNHNMPVTLEVETYGNESFEGSIALIHPTINAATRTFSAEVIVPNADRKLRPGMYGKVNVHLGNYQALMVPALAVLQQKGTAQRFVFIHDNGIAKKVWVKIGKRYDDKLEIISEDIKVGDQLIVAGQQNLEDQKKIKIMK